MQTPTMAIRPTIERSTALGIAGFDEDFVIIPPLELLARPFALAFLESVPRRAYGIMFIA